MTEASRNKTTVHAKLIALLTLTFAFGAGCSSLPSDSGSMPAVDAATLTYFHRFYQGYKLDSVPEEQFMKLMNEQFLPLFPQAQPFGLHAYRPALPVPKPDCKLPSEIALLTFVNEKAYDEYREAEIGQKIRAAHETVFDSGSSKSLVPATYHGKVAFGGAYLLNEQFRNFQDAYSALAVYCAPRADHQLLSQLNEIYAKGSRADNIVFALTQDHVAEYVFAKSEVELATALQERQLLFKLVFKQSEVIRLTKQKIGAKPVSPGQGVDAQW